MNEIKYDFRITFEDNTRTNFTEEGITELIPGDSKMIRLRHTKLITELSQLMKEYMKSGPSTIMRK